MKKESTGAQATLMKTKSSGAVSFLRRLRCPEIIYSVDNPE